MSHPGRSGETHWAIKLMKQHPGRFRGVQPYQLREIMLLRKCRHPNILSLHQVQIQRDGQVWLYSQLLDLDLGVSLCSLS